MDNLLAEEAQHKAWVDAGDTIVDVNVNSREAQASSSEPTVLSTVVIGSPTAGARSFSASAEGSLPPSNVDDGNEGALKRQKTEGTIPKKQFSNLPVMNWADKDASVCATLWTLVVEARRADLLEALYTAPNRDLLTLHCDDQLKNSFFPLYEKAKRLNDRPAKLVWSTRRNAASGTLQSRHNSCLSPPGDPLQQVFMVDGAAYLYSKANAPPMMNSHKAFAKTLLSDDWYTVTDFVNPLGGERAVDPRLSGPVHMPTLPGRLRYANGPQHFEAMHIVLMCSTINGKKVFRPEIDPFRNYRGAGTLATYTGVFHVKFYLDSTKGPEVKDPQRARLTTSKVFRSSAIGPLSHWEAYFAGLHPLYEEVQTPACMEPVVPQDARPAEAKGSNSPARKGSAKGKGRGAPKGSSKGSHYSSFAESKGNSQGSYYAQPQKGKGGKGGKSSSQPVTYYRARGYLHLLYHHNMFPDFEFEIHQMQVELGATLKGYANWVAITPTWHGPLPDKDKEEWKDILPLRWLLREPGVTASWLTTAVEENKLPAESLDDFKRQLVSWEDHAELKAKESPHILYNACLAALFMHLRDLRSLLERAHLSKQSTAGPSALTQTPKELRHAPGAGGQV